MLSSRTHTQVHTRTHTHRKVFADVTAEMLPRLLFSRALMKCRDMTACDKIPPSFTPTCLTFGAAHFAVIVHTHTHTSRFAYTHTQRERATAARPHIDILSPVDGDEEAILAHISTPAVCLDGVCLCMCVFMCVRVGV